VLPPGDEYGPFSADFQETGKHTFGTRDLAAKGEGTVGGNTVFLRQRDDQISWRGGGEEGLEGEGRGISSKLGSSTKPSHRKKEEDDKGDEKGGEKKENLRQGEDEFKKYRGGRKLGGRHKELQRE